VLPRRLEHLDFASRERREAALPLVPPFRRVLGEQEVVQIERRVAVEREQARGGNQRLRAFGTGGITRWNSSFAPAVTGISTNAGLVQPNRTRHTKEAQCMNAAYTDGHSFGRRRR